MMEVGSGGSKPEHSDVASESHSFVSMADTGADTVGFFHLNTWLIF